MVTVSGLESAGAFLVSVVDDETGEPVPGAVAFARPENRELEKDRFPGFRYSPGWSLRADGEGKALLLAMVPGKSHTLRSGADGYARAEMKGLIPGTHENPAEVTIRLKKE